MILQNRLLLAAHNGGPWLKEQVDSILAQTHARLTLLIGDDASGDGAVDELVAHATDARVHSIRFDVSSGGAGQSFLRLFSGADLKDFDFVALSDQDDVWDRDKIARALEALNVHGADGYSAAVTAFWPDGREKLLRQNPETTDLDFMFEGAGQGCTFVMRGEFARKVQQLLRAHHELTKGIHYHDWLIYAISRALGRKWFFD